MPDRTPVSIVKIRSTTPRVEIRIKQTRGKVELHIRKGAGASWRVRGMASDLRASLAEVDCELRKLEPICVEMPAEPSAPAESQTKPASKARKVA